jgi:hypothetical protein
MVPNQMESGRHAQEWRQAQNWVSSKEGGAEATRSAKRRSAMATKRGERIN